MSTAAVETAVEPKRPGRPKGSRNPPGVRNKPGGGRPRKPPEPLPPSTSIWDHGRVTVSLTQQHIDESMQRNSSHCAGVAAIKAAIPDATFVSVDIATVRFSRKGVRYTCLCPTVLQTFVCDYDQGNPVAPIQFTLKAAFIAKAGKARRETPSDAELKEVGLRVAKDQPHIAPEPEPERPKLDPWSDDEAAAASVDSDDRARAAPSAVQEFVAALAPKRRPRVARAKVSAASKGSVPTVLGGRLPPLAALVGRRREFGIRALRR
jgi:hypothetical protein